MRALDNTSSANKRQSPSYRAIAAVIAIACVVAFFLPYTFFLSSPAFATEKLKLYKLFEYIPDTPYKFMGFIPMFTNPKSILGLAGGLVPYALIIFLAVAFVLAVISLIFGQKAERLLTTSILLYTWGVAMYMIAVVSISCYLPMKIVFDAASITLAAVGTLAYVAFLYVKLDRKICMLNCLRFLLTLAFTVCLLLALAFDSTRVSKLLNKSLFYKIAAVIAVALTLVNLVLASVRAAKQRAFAEDFINSAIELAVSVALVVLSITSSVTDVSLLIFSGIAAAISVALFVLTFVSLHASKQQAQTAPAASKPSKKPAPTVTPVIPVTPVKSAPVVTEDFFAGKQIDGFIATLNVTERNQFAAMYLLKPENVMPEVPAYIINGDNRTFFEMIFITLGEYRDQIPDSLLFKMYQHMCVEYSQMEINV